MAIGIPVDCKLTKEEIDIEDCNCEDCPYMDDCFLWGEDSED